MSGREQLPEPAAQLLDVARRVVPRWLTRITVEAAARGGVDPASFGDEIEAVARESTASTLAELEALLALDVDEQPVNPLTVLRGAIAGPTALLRRHGVRPRPVDPFIVERFPDDVYGLGPAAWADIDQELHEPGMMWGAWKAMTVLRRRRDEGLR